MSKTEITPTEQLPTHPVGSNPPPSAQSPAPASARSLGGWVVDALLLVGVVSVLSLWLNFRYPMPRALRDHLLVALEVPAVLLLLVGLKALRVRLRWWAFGLVGLVALAARLFMTADNIAHRFLYRDFRVPLDLHLVPEFFRLLYDTSPARMMVGFMVGLVASLALSFLLVSGSFGLVYRRLARPSFRTLTLGFLALAGVMVLVGELGGPVYTIGQVSSRIGREAVAFTRLPAERKRLQKTIAGISQRIGDGRRLDKLEGTNVQLVFVESYGRTSLNKPAHRKLLMPRYREMEKNLEELGFSIASNFVTSPTFGGFSWFAHGTLNTGFKVVSHLHNQLLLEQEPKALADYFKDAGYRAVTVAPGNTRPWPGMDNHLGFTEHRFSWEFGYRGPRFAWAPMADQFVLDRIQRTLIAPSAQPLFVEYALVNSHAPFSDIPRYIKDWSKVGDGRIYHRVGRHRFKVGWGQAEKIAKAYATSIEYELDVLEGYLTEFVKDDTLMIFLGDHQPNQGVTGSEGLNWSVPIHVVSRRADFVAPFLRRGYTPGMVPEQPMPHVGMERFVEEFLSDFSTEPLAVEPGVWAGAARQRQHKPAAPAKATL